MSKIWSMWLRSQISGGENSKVSPAIRTIQARLVAGDHPLEAALAGRARHRLELDRAHQAQVADVDHVRQITAAVQRVLEVALDLAHPLEDALFLVGLERRDAAAAATGWPE